MKSLSASIVFLFSAFFLADSAAGADAKEIQALNESVRDALRRGLPAPPESLSKRASLLRTAIRTNPAGARALLLEPAVSAALRSRSLKVEAPASYLAENATVVDSSDWLSAYYMYRLTTPDGPVTAFQDSREGAAPACGSQMSLQGYRIGDTMLVTGAKIVAQATQPVCSTLGDQKSAVILAGFPSRPINKLTADQYKAVFFGAGPSVTDFYQEMSYGKASVSGDVFGPFTLDKDYDSCADSNTVQSLAMAAADAVVDLTPYNRIFVIAPSPTSCGFGGYSNVGCATYTFKNAGALRLSSVYQFDAAAAEILRVSPHELGHGLGLLHARTDALNGEALGPDRTRFTYSEYGDLYSSMGGSGPHHFAAPHKYFLKWFDGGETAEATADQTADLLPMASSQHGLKALHVERRLGSKQFVWIEYRTAIGYDASLAQNLSGGALIHFEDPGTGGYSELLDFGSSFSGAELRAGATWSDPYSDLTIQVLEATPDHMRVSTRHDPLCTTVTWPQQSRFGADPFSVTASLSPSTCAWNVSGNNFWVQPEAGNPLASSVTFDAAANSDPLDRAGSVTVARQTLFVSQSPTVQPLNTVYFGPAQAVAVTTSYEVGIGLPNGTATTGSVDVLWNATSALPGGCAFTYDFGTHTARLLDDSGNAGTASVVSGQTSQSLANAVCTIGGLSDIRSTAFLANLFFYWSPRVANQSANVYYRFRSSPNSAPGAWQQAGTVAAVAPSVCAVSATPLLVATGTGGSYTVSIGAANNCAWTVQTGASWVTASPVSGVGNSRIAVSVSSNPNAANRQTALLINSVAVPVTQYAKGVSNEPFVSFLQSELDVARAGSSSTLQFSTSFGDGTMSWTSSSPWLRVTGYQISTAGCPCVTVQWDSNVSPDARQATLSAITLGGAPVPGGALHVVQDSGRARPGDYQLTTVAGTDYAVDGQQALTTYLKQPAGLTLDPNGNLMVAETDGNRFRKIAQDGATTTFAGTGFPTPLPYLGTARQVGTLSPQDVVSDGSGGVYILSSNQIRLVRNDGSVTLIAGSGSFGFSGDGGPAAKAAIYIPAGAALAPNGTLYFSDSYNHRIRIVTTDGTISTFAGTGTAGYSGDDGPAINARLNYPAGLAIAPDGSLLVADRYNHRIRRISTSGTISLVAGSNASCAFSGDGGPATSARLCYPQALTVGADGNLFIADTSNYRVRRVSPDGVISTVAGSGVYTGVVDSGPATGVAIGSVSGITRSASGDLYLSNNNSGRILVLRNGTVMPFAGLGPNNLSGDGGPALAALFHRPSALAADSTGNVFFIDAPNNRVHMLSANGVVSLFAGNGQYAYGGDGKAAVSASIPLPSGLAVAADGSVYIASFCEIRKVDAAGIITTFAGSTSCGYADSSSPLKALFSSIAGLALDGSGNLYLADSGNQRIRKIGTDGSVTTVAGNGKTGTPVDRVQATASPLNNPADVAVDAAGNLYIADRGSYTVRRVGSDGFISTFAGTAYGYSGDGGLATLAKMGAPQAVKVDTNGAVWISDPQNHVVRKVAADGTISTVAGTGAPGFTSEDSSGWSSQLNAPSGLAVAPDGVYLSDGGNGRVRVLRAVTAPQ